MESIINSYVEQIKYFWQYGFADTVYNFTINNGLDNFQNLVLIDFNEITDDSNRVAESIKNKVWNTRFSVNQHLNEAQKTYFRQKMSEEITEENLRVLWNIKTNEKNHI